MIKNLMDEYFLQIDDVRWYLSLQVAKQLIEYKNDLPNLTDFICSKRLEIALYDMEESFLQKIENDYEKQIIDESGVREIVSAIITEKEKRNRHFKRGY